MKSLMVKCAVLLLAVTTTALAQPGLGLEYGNRMDFNVRDYSRPVLEGYQFEFGGAGSRALGMGKAFIGLSDDVTAISWNPGGLYSLSQPILSVSYRSTLPRGYTDTDPQFTIGGFDSRLDHSGSIAGVSAVNFAAPIRIKGHPFVGSFAYSDRYDEYQGYQYAFDTTFRDTFTSEAETYVDTVTSYTVDHVSQMDGSMKSVSFGFGTRIYKDVSVGAALNVFTGSMVRDGVMREVSNDRIDASFQEYTVVYTTTVLDSNSFSGYNFTLGARYNAEPLALGLIVRTPFDLEVETDRSIFAVAERNGRIAAQETDTFYYDDMVSKYQMPFMMGLGAAYRVNERMVLTADVEYRRFSSQSVLLRDSVKLDPGGQNEEFYTSVSADTLWRDVLQLAVGGEYLWDRSWGRVPLRFGLAYVPTVVPSYERVEGEDGDITGLDSASIVSLKSTPERTSGMLLSAGFGVWWQQIHLDFAYSYLTRDWDTGIPGAARTGAFHQRIRNHQLNATFTGYF